jgi:hypothetical protein
MGSKFEISGNSLHGDDDRPLEPSRWSPLVFTALMITLAACSAAFLMQ